MTKRREQRPGACTALDLGEARQSGALVKFLLRYVIDAPQQGRCICKIGVKVPYAQGSKGKRGRVTAISNQREWLGDRMTESMPRSVS